MEKTKFDYIAWIRGSLDNSKEGASSKKMAAFYVVMGLVTPPVYVYTWWAFRSGKWDLLPEILGTLLLFAAAALSINGAEKIIDRLKSKNENNNNTPDPGPGPGA